MVARFFAVVCGRSMIAPTVNILMRSLASGCLFYVAERADANEALQKNATERLLHCARCKAEFAFAARRSASALRRKAFGRRRACESSSQRLEYLSFDKITQRHPNGCLFYVAKRADANDALPKAWRKAGMLVPTKRRRQRAFLARQSSHSPPEDRQ